MWFAVSTSVLIVPPFFFFFGFSPFIMFRIFISKEMGSWDWSVTCSHKGQGAESSFAILKQEFPAGQRGFLFMTPWERRESRSKHRAQPRQAGGSPAGSLTYPFSECLSAHLLTGSVLSTGDIAATEKAKGETLISRSWLLYNCPSVFVKCWLLF